MKKELERPDGLGMIEHLMASGEMVAAQVAAHSQWSPELRLAGAVLASALEEVREHGRSPAYRKRIQEDLSWIESDDTAWPFSFRRLCDLFGLEAEWVRARVREWLAAADAARGRSGYRTAA